MTISNKSNVKKRSDKTTPLTQVEVDQNFQEVRNVIDDAENNESRVEALEQVNSDAVRDYTTGLAIDSYSQILRDTSGEFWRLSGSVALPYTTTGAGLPEGGNFVAVGDAALRRELTLPVSEGNGAALVNGAAIYVSSVAELEALSPDAGVNIYLTENGREGDFVFVSGNQSSNIASDPQKSKWVAPNSDPTGSSGAFKRSDQEPLSIRVAGSTGAEGEDITAFVQSMVGAGVKHIVVPQKNVTISSSIDLQGATLEGYETEFSGNVITGGQLLRIYRSNVRPLTRGGTPFNISTSRTRTKILVKESLTPTGSSTAYDENYSIISPSGHGGIARFALANGIGGSGANDLGAPYDRLRVIGAFIYIDGYAICHQTSAQTAGVVDSGINLNSELSVASGLYSTDGDTSTTAYNIPAGESVEFTVDSSNSRNGNICFYTSVGSTADITVEVNGTVQTIIAPKTIGGGPTNTLRTVPIVYDERATQVVKITNNGPESYCYVFGVNFYRISNLPPIDYVGKDYWDKVVLSGQRNILYTGTGASIDSVVVDGSGIFGGSFHGGDLGSESLIRLTTEGGLRNIRAEMSTFTPSAGESINVGEIWPAKHIFVRYRGEIQYTPALSTWIDYDFGVDGGCEVRGSYTANAGDFTFNTIYTGMHSTDRSLLNIIGDSFSSADNNFTSYPLSQSPFIQYSNLNAQVAITPQFYEMDNTDRGQQVWNATPYIKYYYTPIQGQNVVLKNGNTFTFACRYQYGEAIV